MPKTLTKTSSEQSHICLPLCFVKVASGKHCFHYYTEASSQKFRGNARQKRTTRKRSLMSVFTNSVHVLLSQ